MLLISDSLKLITISKRIALVMTIKIIEVFEENNVTCSSSDYTAGPANRRLLEK